MDGRINAGGEVRGNPDGVLVPLCATKPLSRLPSFIEPLHLFDPQPSRPLPWTPNQTVVQEDFQKRIPKGKRRAISLGS